MHLEFGSCRICSNHHIFPIHEWKKLKEVHQRTQDLNMTGVGVLPLV